MAVEFPKVGQGVAKPASSQDIARDNVGFTHPNLHRRIEDNPTLKEPEIDKSYTIALQSVNSYRTTEVVYHDEESTTSEIP